MKKVKISQFMDLIKGVPKDRKQNQKGMSPVSMHFAMLVTYLTHRQHSDLTVSNTLSIRKSSCSELML